MTQRQINTLAVRKLLPWRKRFLMLFGGRKPDPLTARNWRNPAIALLFAYFPIQWIASWLGGNAPTYAMGILYLSACLFAVAAALETVALLKTNLAKLISPTLVSIGVLIVGGIATIVARSEVNELVRTDPSALPYAVSALTGTLLPSIWLTLVGATLGLGGILSISFATWLQILERSGLLTTALLIRNSTTFRILFARSRSKWTAPSSSTVSARGFGLVFLGIATLWLGIFAGGAWRKPLLKPLIVWSQYSQFSQCINHKSGELVAFLSESRISVAIEDETGDITFSSRPCELPSTTGTPSGQSAQLN
ncbi:hypothetical protein LZ198_37370 [Myxococcus sp. K15C18031901]|uniref:hypothetical protein n=1 Tax=Myxococcus dinghuensis TaxID=2906761 RepID=UPI0020A716C9|nr:hypothetical protein [Myxococcus dinghuensis]MCP3104549.1 hypothetical protein [Myxococcus dinghuensis]